MNKAIGHKVLGTVVGAVIGYLVTDWVVVTYFPTLAHEPALDGDDLIGSIKDSQLHDKFDVVSRRLLFEDLLTEADASSAPALDVVDLSDIAAKKIKETLIGYNNMYQPGKSDLNLVARKYMEIDEKKIREENNDEPPIDTELSDEEVIQKWVDNYPDEGPIHQITAEEFAAPGNTNMRTVLNSYEDGVITDANDEPVPFPESIIGEVGVGLFSEDSDVVYVRNETIGADYEIYNAGRTYVADPSEEITKQRREMSARRKNRKVNGENG